MKEIAQKHIMKRWTVDARDILPGHLLQYQKDSGLMKSFSYMHSHLYLNAMEMVRLGDTNVEAYQVAIAMLKEGMPKIAASAVEGDCLGLEERMRAKKSQTTVVELCARGASSVDRASDGTTISLDAALLASAKVRSGGRPIPVAGTSRHTKQFQRRPVSAQFVVNQDTKNHLPSKCSNCGLAGHRKTNCIQNNCVL